MIVVVVNRAAFSAVVIADVRAVQAAVSAGVPPERW